MLPYDQVNAELFYPSRKENKDTNSLVVKMAVEVAKCLLKELRDPNKATSDYLTSEEGVFSWGNTTDEEHQACIGKMATNDPAEGPFAALTSQLQYFGRVLGMHASGVGQARINGDFDLDLNDGNTDGTYYMLPENMRKSLLKFALKISPEFKKKLSEDVQRQQLGKLKKKQALREKMIIEAQREYADALIYIDMYYLSACWKHL